MPNAVDFFVQELLTWFPKNARNLPWRNTTNPYHIWLSEIILQQTRVNQGMPYYEKFVAQYPTLADLAQAPEQEVLRLWQGLGYYSRARNMRTTAQEIMQKWNGQFPNNFKDLLTLKGVGRYTAAAIASFAFNEPVAVVDGNVYRVLSRYFGITTDITSTQGKKEFEQLANEILPPQQAATYNQAIMEFGALQCVPAGYVCMFCPLHSHCVAFATHQQDELPVKSKKTAVKEAYMHYLVLQDQTGKYWLRERKKGNIWQGLYDFLSLDSEKPIETETILTELQLDTDTLQHTSHYHKHILTHRIIWAKFYHIKLPPHFDTAILREKELNDYTFSEILDLPKPILIANYVENKDQLFNI